MAQVTADPARWNRFSGLHPRWAASALLLFAALALFGLASGVGGDRIQAAQTPSTKADALVGDHALYAGILRRVAAGESYYPAAVAEHRAHDYPLRPFFTVRLPTLAYGLVALGPQGSIALSVLIGGAAILAWRRRLASEPGLPVYAPFAALIMAANMTQLGLGEWVLIHEVVAGVLVALALALYRPGRPWMTMAIIAIALTIRETVLPVAMLLGLFALIDRDWRAVAGWTAIGLGFATLLALHVMALAALVDNRDAASPGWDGMGGWSAYLTFVHATSVFRLLPGWATALAVPLALLGWAAWRARLGTAMLAVQLAYAALLMLFARPNNFYWAMLVVPTLFAGLILAPAALTALARSIGGSRTGRSGTLPAGLT